MLTTPQPLHRPPPHAAPPHCPRSRTKNPLLQQTVNRLRISTLENTAVTSPSPKLARQIPKIMAYTLAESSRNPKKYGRNSKTRPLPRSLLSTTVDQVPEARPRATAIGRQVATGLRRIRLNQRRCWQGLAQGEATEIVGEGSRHLNLRARDVPKEGKGGGRRCSRMHWEAGGR